MTQGVIWKQLLRFFFPVFFGMLFQQLYNTIDAMIVGRFVGKAALAAVGGSTTSLVNMLVGFFTGLASGATVVVSQYFGAEDDHRVSQSVHTAIALALCGGALLTVVGVFGVPSFLQMMGTPSDVLSHATIYLQVYFAGIIPLMVYNMGSGILQAVGNSRLPFLFLATSCLCNIALDLLLVAYCGLGTMGAALATILSEVLSATLVLLALSRAKGSFRLSLCKIRCHWEILRRMLHIGFPSALQAVMYAISNLLIQVRVNQYGTDTLAGWSAYCKIENTFWVTMTAFTVTISTFAGQNFGAGLYQRFKRGVRVGVTIAMGMLVCVTLLIMTFDLPLLSLFTSDAAALQEGRRILRFMVPTFITYVLVEFLPGAMRGAGDVKMATITTLITICLFRIFWCLVAIPQGSDILLILACYPISWVVTSGIFIVYYKRGNWLTRRIANRA